MLSLSLTCTAANEWHHSGFFCKTLPGPVGSPRMRWYDAPSAGYCARAAAARRTEIQRSPRPYAYGLDPEQQTAFCSHLHLGRFCSDLPADLGPVAGPRVRGQQFRRRYGGRGISAGTVCVENADASNGFTYYFEGAGTAPAVGTDLLVGSQTGGTATFTFQADVDSCTPGEAIVNRADVSTASSSDKAIAVTECVE